MKSLTMIQKLGLPMALFTIISGSLPLQAEAHGSRYYPDRYRPASFGQKHPYVQKAAIGGGVGAVLGGVLAQDGYRGDGAIKGALLGAGAGLGYEYLKRQGTFNNRGW